MGKESVNQLLKRWQKIDLVNHIVTGCLVALLLVAILSKVIGVPTNVAGDLSIIVFLLLAFQALVPNKYSHQQLVKLDYLKKSDNNQITMSDYPKSFRKLDLNDANFREYFTSHWFNWI